MAGLKVGVMLECEWELNVRSAELEDILFGLETEKLVGERWEGDVVGEIWDLEMEREEEEDCEGEIDNEEGLFRELWLLELVMLVLVIPDLVTPEEEEECR